MICQVPWFSDWTLWVRIHVWYLYQSFIDGSNIWGVDGTYPWGLEIDHPPLGRCYLAEVPSYDMSSALFLLTGLYGWDSSAGIEMSPSWMGPIFRVWVGPTLGARKGSSAIGPQLFGRIAVVWYVRCLDSLTGLYGWDSMSGIYINPSSMGPIFGVWVGPTLGVPKWTICNWAAAIW